MALQRLGDEDLPRLLELVTDWSADSDPLVRPRRTSASVRPVTWRLGRRRNAADPEHGVSRFRALADLDDPDVAWVIRENSKKARIARLL